jgi:aminoglycoside phosphotransferase (APT) family kinase protein
LLSVRALRAAVEVAEEAGLRFDRPTILRDRSNLLVHLAPARVVARIATATGIMRSGDAWLAREVAVAGYLAAAGAPVVAPSLEIPPGPHHRDGFALTFWEYVEELDDPLDAPEAGRGLRLCHEALADFTAELPRMAALAEAVTIADDLAQSGAVGVRDAELMRRAGARAQAGIGRISLPLQPVHGDAHLGNVIVSPRGPLWNDWEDAFLGPVGWDIGCLCASAPPFGRRDPSLIAAARQGYGDGIDAEVLDAFIAARRFQAAVWGVVIAQALPDDGHLEERLGWFRR